jgi:acyl carrier protein
MIVSSDIGDLSESQLLQLESLLLAGNSSASDLEKAELVAYYVTNDGYDVDDVELRSYVERFLPTPGTPVHFVAVAEAPPEAVGDASTSPRSDTERWICGIWTAVLGVPVRSVDADFFKLGGSSLHAVQVLVRIESMLGIQPELASLFENRTVAALAALVEAESHIVPDFAEIIGVAAGVYAEAGAGRSVEGDAV